MVVGFITTNAITAFHNKREFETRSGDVHSIQHYVNKFVSVAGRWFPPGTHVFSTNKTGRHYIVKNDVEHHKLTKTSM